LKAKSILHLISIVVGVLISGICQAELIYNETFDNATSDAHPMDGVGWRANHGPTAVAYNSSSVNNLTDPVIAKTEYLYVAGGVVPSGEAMIAWTDVQSFGSIANLTNISFRLSGNSTEQAIRLAVQVGSDWFASDDVYSPATASTASSTTFSAFSVDVQSVSWRTLDFTSGYVLGDPVSVTTLPISGTVNAIGFYTSEQLERFRFDDVSVYATVPEPGSIGLLLISSCGLFLGRRRLMR